MIFFFGIFYNRLNEEETDKHIVTEQDIGKLCHYDSANWQYDRHFSP